MATTYKILGQHNGITETIVYTVPAGTSAVCSTIAVVSNGSTGIYSIAVQPAADSTTQMKHYIAYTALINQYESIFLTLGITLAAGDKILCSSDATISVSVFGSEIV